MPRKKAINYTVQVEDRSVFFNGMSLAFTGPFLHLFNEYRQVTGRIEDQGRGYLRYGRQLGTTLDLLLEHLASIDAWGEQVESTRVWVSELAMAGLEDLDRIQGSYVNVVSRIHVKEGDEDEAKIEVFEIEEFDQLHEAMLAADDRAGGEADVWTVDVTVMDVVGRQVAASKHGSAKIEQRAVELLRKHNAEFFHSGGGIMLCQVELVQYGREFLVSESEVSPGRFWLGVYDVKDGERNEEAEMFDLLDSHALAKKVDELVASYASWVRRPAG